MEIAPHHLIGGITPDKYITVVEYQSRCLQKIFELNEKPGCNGVVLVGGTNYYVESIIFEDNINKHDEEAVSSNANIIEGNTTAISKRDDASVFQYIHPNNKRKLKKLHESDTEKVIISKDTVYNHYI